VNLVARNILLIPHFTKIVDYPRMTSSPYAIDVQFLICNGSTVEQGHDVLACNDSGQSKPANLFWRLIRLVTFGCRRHDMVSGVNVHFQIHGLQ